MLLIKVIGSEIMKISSTSIISKISSDFTSVYRPQSNFPGSGVLWNECINAIQDAKLMNHIIFCNDVMKNTCKKHSYALIFKKEGVNLQPIKTKIKES